VKTPPGTATIRIETKVTADYPLSKYKFALFNSGLVPISTYRRDSWALEATRPESIRIDIGWGAEWMNWKSEVAQRNSDTVVYDFSELNDLAAVLTTLKIRPYWSYCYVPKVFRPPGGDWRTLDRDDSGWVEMVRSYVESAKAAGLGIGYHEVYNEPDLRDERTGEPVFYRGDLADYLDLYAACAPAIRSADADSPIGGPALASVPANEHWIPALLDRVREENLPLDFLSFHHYGRHSVGAAIDRVFTQLASKPGTAELETHLNEYNSFPVDYPRGGFQDGHHMASALLKDFHDLLARPGLTRVHWAQFLDSGSGNYSGLIDIDGASKAAFYAYQLFHAMPTDRIMSHVDGTDVNAFAAREPGRTEVLVFSRAGHSTAVALQWEGLTSDVEAVDLLLVDAAHLTPVTSSVRIVDGITTFELPAGGFALLRVRTSSGVFSPPAPAGAVVRTRHSYPDRWTTAWADIDERATTFRFGSASSPASVPAATMVLRDFAPVLEIVAHVHRNALDLVDAGRAVSVRIGDGRSTVQIDLAAARPSASRWPSWAGPENADSSVDAATGSTQIDLSALGFTGSDLTITAIVQTGDTGLFVTITLLPA